MPMHVHARVHVHAVCARCMCMPTCVHAHMRVHTQVAFPTRTCVDVPVHVPAYVHVHTRTSVHPHMHTRTPVHQVAFDSMANLEAAASREPDVFGCATTCLRIDSMAISNVRSKVFAARLLVEVCISADLCICRPMHMHTCTLCICIPVPVLRP